MPCDFLETIKEVQMKNLKFFALSILVLFSLFGCQMLSERIEDNDPLLTIATGRAVDYLISEADDPQDRARQILRRATTIKTALEGDDIVSFDSLRERLVAEIPRDRLLPGEYDLIVALVNDVIDATRERLEELDPKERFDKGKVSIVYFLDIAIRTAQYRLMEN